MQFRKMSTLSIHTKTKVEVIVATAVSQLSLECFSDIYLAVESSNYVYTTETVNTELVLKLLRIIFLSCFGPTNVEGPPC